MKITVETDRVCVLDLFNEAKKNIEKINDPIMKEALGILLIILDRFKNVLVQKELGGDPTDPKWGRFKSGKS